MSRYIPHVVSDDRTSARALLTCQGKVAETALNADARQVFSSEGDCRFKPAVVICGSVAGLRQPRMVLRLCFTHPVGSLMQWF